MLCHGLNESCLAKTICSADLNSCFGIVIFATGTNDDYRSGISIDASSIGILLKSVCN